jgi:hypothetical protein
MSVYKASNISRVPTQKLRDRVKELTDANVGHITIFTNEEEERLMHMAEIGYWCTKMNIPRMDKEYTLTRKTNAKQANTSILLSNNWFYGFMKR